MASDPYVESSVSDALALFDPEDSGIHRAVSFRVGIEQLARVDAMASHAKSSRQLMMTRLLRVGMAVISSKLSPDAMAEIDDLTVDRYQNLIDLGGDASC